MSLVVLRTKIKQSNADPAIKSKALAGLRKIQRTKSYQKKVELHEQGFRDWLISSFVFSKTEEGQDFWYELHRLLEEGD